MARRRPRRRRGPRPGARAWLRPVGPLRRGGRRRGGVACGPMHPFAPDRGADQTSQIALAVALRITGLEEPNEEVGQCDDVDLRVRGRGGGTRRGWGYRCGLGSIDGGASRRSGSRPYPGPAEHLRPAQPSWCAWGGGPGACRNRRGSAGPRRTVAVESAVGLAPLAARWQARREDPGHENPRRGVAPVRLVPGQAPSSARCRFHCTARGRRSGPGPRPQPGAPGTNSAAWGATSPPEPPSPQSCSPGRVRRSSGERALPRDADQIARLPARLRQVRQDANVGVRGREEPQPHDLVLVRAAHVVWDPGKERTGATGHGAGALPSPRAISAWRWGRHRDRKTL